MKDGGPPPQRDMRQLAHHRAPDPATAAAVSAPIIVVDRAAREDRTLGLKALAGDLQTEAVEAAETSQIRGPEGSVGHVEVFQMGSVRTSIFGGPRPLQPAATPQPCTARPTPSFVKSHINAVGSVSLCIGADKAMMRVLVDAYIRAPACGWKPTASMAPLIRSFVAWETGRLPDRA